VVPDTVPDHRQRTRARCERLGSRENDQERRWQD